MPGINKAKTASMILAGIVKEAHSVRDLFSQDARMGNAFVRVGNDFAAMTPTGNKFDMNAGHVSIVNIRSGIAINGVKQTSEYRMYLEILRALPGTTAGMHLHGCFSLPLVKVMGAESLGMDDFAEADHYLGKRGKKGRICKVKGKSGSIELAKAVAGAFLDGAQVVIIFGPNNEYHGTVAISSSNDPLGAAREALNKLIDVEYAAKVKIAEFFLREKQLRGKRL